jgi:hypothetical protein
MLRRLVATGSNMGEPTLGRLQTLASPINLASLIKIVGTGFCCFAVACGSAAPVDVGVDYAVSYSESGPLPNSSQGAAPSQDAGVGVVPATEDPVEFDAFLNQSWERGTVSSFCRSSFQACGGILAGTWEVEDTCNPETNDRDVLQRWGAARMSLDPVECSDAVQRLTASWSGQLAFKGGKAVDGRMRAQKVDVELTASCLGATLGLDEETAVEPRICDSMRTSSTTCGASAGVCMCSNRTVAPGDVSGVYGVLGETVAVKNTSSSTTTIYEYCVEGDRLLWREPNTLRHLVMRRTSGAPPPEGDPMQVPH